MSAIFISHSTQDKVVALRVLERLRQRGYQSLFLDSDPEAGIKAGTDWERDLYRNLRLAAAVVVLCSPDSMASRWCFAEITQAKALGKALFPVVIRPCELVGSLTDRQAVDFAGWGEDEGFRRLFDGLRVAGMDPGDSFNWGPDRPPFPGLLYFDAADAGIYFGRDAEVRRVIELLTRLKLPGEPRLALVVGSSGSGKSSLVRAGVLPRLAKGPERWAIVPPFRPGASPVGELARAVASAFPRDSNPPDWKALRDRLKAPPVAAQGGPPALADAADDLAMSLGRREASVLVVVDQAEELLQSAHDDEATAFLTALLDGLNHPGSRVFALMTLRSDFLGSFQNHPALRGVPFADVPLGLMPVENFPQVIEGPAARAEIAIEPGLVARMVHDAQTDDALPLLAFTLREMYERCRGEARFTLKAYRDDLGGIQGAVSRVVERINAQSPWTDEVVQSLRRAFLKLVRVNDEGRFIRQRARWADLPDLATPVLEKFVHSRLLTSDGDMVEVAHESLFRVWPELEGWLKAGRELMLWKRGIADELGAWERNHREGQFLAPGRLAEARRWLAESPGEFETEAAFLAAQIAEEDRAVAEEAARRDRELETQKQLASEAEARAAAECERATAATISAKKEHSLRQKILAVAALAGVIAAFAGFQTWNESLARLKADAATRKAEKSEGETREALATAFLRLANAEFQQAFIARDFDFDPAAARHHFLHAADAAERAKDRPYARSALYAAAFLGGVGDQTVTSGNPPERRGNAGRVQSIFLSSLSNTAIAGLDLSSFVSRSDDGSRVLTGLVIPSPGRSTKYFLLSERATNRQLAQIDAEEVSMRSNYDSSIKSAVLSGDGTKIMILTDRHVSFWRAEAPHFVSCQAHEGPEVEEDKRSQGSPLGAFFSRDGSRAVSWDTEFVYVWDLSRWSPGGPKLGCRFRVAQSNWFAGGSHILWVRTAADRLRVITDSAVWELSLTGPIGELKPTVARIDLAAVEYAAFNRDESKLLNWGPNTPEAALCDLATGRRLASVVHPSPLAGGVWAPSERLVFTWSTDGTGYVWDTQGKDRARLKCGAGFRDAWFVDDDHVVTLGGDGLKRAWEIRSRSRSFDTDEGRSPFLAPSNPVLGAVLTLDGARLITWTERVARLWDVSTGQSLAGFVSGGLAPLVSPDGRHLVARGDDDSLSLRVIEPGSRAFTLVPASKPSPNTLQASFGPDGSRLATWVGRRITVWDTARRSPTATITAPDAVAHAFFCDGGRKLFAWAGMIACLYDVGTGGVVAEDKGTGDGLWDNDPRHRVVGPTGRHVLIPTLGKRDPVGYQNEAGGVFLVRDVVSRKVIARLKHDDGYARPVEFSIDESRVVTVQKGTVWIWDVARETPLATLRHSAPYGASVVVEGARLSRDAARVVTRSNAGVVTVWDVKTERPVAAFEHSDRVDGAILSDDGNRVLSWGKKGAFLRDVNQERPLAMLPHEKIMNFDALVYEAVFAHGEDRILTWDHGGIAKLWDLTIDKTTPISSQILDLEARTDTIIDENGRYRHLTGEERLARKGPR